MDEAVTDPRLFNGSVETGVRALLILEACHPKTLDLDTMSLFDYFVVHTEDIGGPPSLHPAIGSRVGEYHVRRRVIQDGLRLMRRASLVDVVEAKDGLRFAASEDAPAFVRLMGTEYNVDLFARSKWLAEQWREAGDEFLSHLRGNIERWSLEFREEGGLSDA
ncbi:ABC-three component system middle component 2 [Labrys monachus]|uniref:Threonine transporter n=1 Tax=Labrys monachus TaxID=217067 RepID=A0ABU0F6J4_9HYPH|nr:ABC-three component system middle component 2 [Labrys monachus]MDQ0390229.1 hypothetical protein [Labrys monachus]